jgi:hypothetical protein
MEQLRPALLGRPSCQFPSSLPLRRPRAGILQWLLAAEPQAAAVALAMFAYALSHPISSSIARSMLEAASQGDREKRMRHDGTIQPPDRGGRSTMQRLEGRRQHNAHIGRLRRGLVRAPLVRPAKSRAWKEASSGCVFAARCSTKERVSRRSTDCRTQRLAKLHNRKWSPSRRPASSDPGCSRQRFRRRLHRHASRRLRGRRAGGLLGPRAQDPSPGRRGILSRQSR